LISYDTSPGVSQVDVICEEAKHGVESIAETVADREALRYRYIEMPMRRAELGIPLDNDVLSLEVSPEQKARLNELQESYITDGLVTAIAGARAAVVICGVGHVPASAQALQSRFARVEQYDVTAVVRSVIALIGEDLSPQA
jgi:hypothetical protein